MEETAGFLARVLISWLVELLLVGSARLLLPVLTFGRWRIAPSGQLDGLYPWRIYKRQADGTLTILSSPVALIMGLSIWTFGGIFLLEAIA